MITKLEEQKQEASDWLKKHGASNLIPEAMQKIEKDHKRKQKLNHIIFWIIVFSVVVGIMNKVTAQTSDNLIVLGGYKSFEVGYVLENTEFLNFGFSFSAADSELLERRANRNDIYRKVHEFNNKITPAGFFLVGATFDKISITGKSGIAYLDQKINGIQDKQKMYWAVGILLSHELTEKCSLIVGYDNINSAQIGVQYKF